MSTAALPVRTRHSVTGVRLAGCWPVIAITVLGAVLRLSTLNLQSFWFDEAFTPTHVLHASLFKTLHAVTRTENSPPLWYVVEWLDWRILGDGQVALRLPSALAGIALVPVGWGIGAELAGRRAAVATAALLAACPVFVWYSQEARVYSLYALTSAVAILCFLRVLRAPTSGRLAAFALAGAVALLTHYFAVFLLFGMAVWLLVRPQTRRASVPALAGIGVVGAALVPLIAAQGGRNTSWIGQWALSSRLEAIPQYFLTGYSGAPLGHGIELLVALPLLAAIALGLWRMLEPASVRDGGMADAGHRRGGAIALWLTACGFLIPLALALAGSDYLAPRNALAAMVPTAALIAVLGTWPRIGALGPALLALGAAGLLAISIDVDLSPRLQRGNWRGLAATLPAGAGGERAITTVLFGSAPLEYYIPGLVRLPAGSSVKLREIVETGELPLLASAGRAPAGFRLLSKRRVDGLVAYRFVSARPRRVSETQLRRDVIDPAAPWVLVRRRPNGALG
jgi:mannosyltransferase